MSSNLMEMFNVCHFEMLGRIHDKELPEGRLQVLLDSSGEARYKSYWKL